MTTKSMRFIRVAVLMLSATAMHGQVSVESPGELAWSRLMAGNQEFIQGKSAVLDELVKRRGATSTGQSPRISVVACADSRVSPELLFNQSLGDLFIIRTAGNVLDQFAVASLEYAALPGHDWTDLIVVVGHSSCGAIKAAVSPEDPPTPSLLGLVNHIRESLLDVEYSDQPSPETLRRATMANARSVVSHLSAHSSLLRNRIRNGRTLVIPAYHDLSTGVITRIED